MSESERPATGASGGGLDVDALYEEALRLDLLSDGWQKSGECKWNAVHVALLKAKGYEQLSTEHAALAAENEQLKARCEGLEAQVSRCSSCGEVMPNVPNLFCSAGCAG